MRQLLEVTLDGRDDPITAHVDGRDIRRWEAAHDASFLTDPLSYTALTELAGYAAIRDNLFKGTLAEFLDLAVDVRQVSEEPARPTKKGRGRG